MSTDEVKVRVVTVGEAMLRFANEVGTDITFANRLNVYVAGAEANFAAAMAGLGAEAVWVSRLPRNYLGRLVLATLRRHGVDTRHVQMTEDGRLGVYYTNTLQMPGGFEVVYDRENTTFAELRAESFDEATLDGADLVHLTGITVALGRRSENLVKRVIEAASERGLPISFDINYRSALWNLEAAGEALSSIIPLTDVLICSMTDACALFSPATQDPEWMVQNLHRTYGLKAVVLTLSETGCIAYDGETIVKRTSIPTPVLDRIGRGDAFAAGFMLGWLRSGIRDGTDLGVAAAAAAQTTMGDLPQFTHGDLRRLLDGSADCVYR